MPYYDRPPAEIARLLESTGLQLVAWLDVGHGPLVPVLGRVALEQAERRRRALHLNGRAVVEAQAEPDTPPPAA